MSSVFAPIGLGFESLPWCCSQQSGERSFCFSQGALDGGCNNPNKRSCSNGCDSILQFPKFPKREKVNYDFQILASCGGFKVVNKINYAF